MADKRILTTVELRNLLRYDEGTGCLFWRPRPAAMFSHGRYGKESSAKAWNARYANTPALSMVSKDGYRRGLIFGKDYIAHRVIWALCHGNWPEQQIDHINHDRSDNRICNLRKVDAAQNNRNQKIRRDNKSGVVGVCFSASENKWIATIGDGRKVRRIGAYEMFEDAVCARKTEEQALGYHPNHGRA